MPQLGQYKWISDVVFFLYGSREEALSGSEFGGTGFFIAVPSSTKGRYHVHAVTNWHVACRGASTIRVNRHDNSTETFDLDPSEWIFRTSWHDIAISPPLQIDQSIHKVEALHMDCLVGADDIIKDDIGPAEDVFMVGRFVDYTGSETNNPSYRFGNISIVDAAIRQPTGYFGGSFVIDMHSRTGYSGSPVWVYRTPGTVFSRNWPPSLTVPWHYVKLLGIHWGQFPERWDLKDNPYAEHAAQQASLVTDGKYVEGLSGMTCAAPASAILELLMHKQLVAMRKANDQVIAQSPEIRFSAKATVAQSGLMNEYRVGEALKRSLGLDRPYVAGTAF